MGRGNARRSRPARLPVVGVEVSPGKKPAQAAALGLVAAVNDNAVQTGRTLAGEHRGKPFESGKGLAARSAGGLDLHRQKVCPLLQDQVDFQAATVPIEGEPRPASAMKMGLRD